MKFVFLVLCLSLSFITVFAQGEIDAFRYSQSAMTGTARSLGLGGAASTMGADHSAATLNPAGLALFRRGQIAITPAFRVINNDATYLDGSGSDQKTNFGIAHFGINFSGKVKRQRKEAESGLKSYTFAFGYNQLENYHREGRASGYNMVNSITDNFVEQANGTHFDNLDLNGLPGLAYYTFLIDTLTQSSNQYFPAVNGGNVQQTIGITEEGRNNEWFLSLAGNVDDKLYVGFTLGIQDLKYEQNFLIQEEDINDLHEFYQNDPAFQLEFPMEDLRFTDNFMTRGSGVNARLGILVRPLDQLRVGVSFQSPTFLALTDEYSSSMSHSFEVLDNNGTIKTETLEQESNPGIFDYNLTTPYMLGVGAMWIFGKAGFISADFELKDYASARLSSSYTVSDPAYYAFSEENANINELFRLSYNYRVGGELRMDALRFRAGAGIYGSGLTEQATNYQDYTNPKMLISLNPSRRVLSFGMGYRQPNYFLDVVYVNQHQKDKLNPYSLSSEGSFIPSMISTVNKHLVALSLGFNI